MISYRNYHIAIGKSLLWQFAIDIQFASGLLGYGNSRKTIRGPWWNKEAKDKNEGEKLNMRDN